MKNIFPIFCFLLFSFCSKRENQYPRLISPEVEDVVEVNTNHMLQSLPVLLGINFKSDTTILKTKQRNNEKPKVDFKKDTLFKKFNLKVIIDTSYEFNSKEFEYKWYNLPKFIDSITKLNVGREQFKEIVTSKYYGKINKLRKDNVNSYPLLIYNYGNENAYLKEIGYSNFRLIQQAKDIDGKWKPIEFIHSGGTCFITYDYFLLQPKNYLATAIIKYKGNFKTKLRVKIQLGKYYYYSNEIIGFINRTQFNQDFCKDYLKVMSSGFSEKYFEMDKDYMFLKNKF